MLSLSQCYKFLILLKLDYYKYIFVKPIYINYAG